jgi:predicted MFS family arabinose efflux permease
MREAVEMNHMATKSVQTPAGPAEIDESRPRVSWREWYAVFVLTLFILLSFIDRSALNLLAGPIKADLHLSDTQLSLLLGMSFSLFYSLVGLPGGYLIDRFPRRRLLFGAVMIWSAMTATCGFARAFGQVFVGRMGVGLGEAFVSPAAFSIIRDAFPTRLRARALSVFYIGSACGTGAALLVVGGLVDFVPKGGLQNVPVFGTLAAWQLVLAIIGLGGLPLSFLIWTVREPRRQIVAVTPDTAPSMGAAVKHLWSRRRLYVPLFLAQGCGGIAAAGSSAWIPSYIIRTWSLDMHHVGLTLGALSVVGAFFGMASSGYVLDKCGTRLGYRILPLIGGVAVICAGGCWMVATRLSDIHWLWVLISAAGFLTPWGAIAGAATLSRVTPGTMMGKFTAIHFLVYNLLGYGLGPTLVAMISDNFFAGQNPLGHAISYGAGGAMATGGVLLLVVSACMRPSKIAEES